ncbi:MAG: SOS response-associated peptidase [Candidatus Kerfeldbacteria bacterium]
MWYNKRMCGRYSLIASPNELKERFRVKKIDGKLVPRFNAAPAQQLPLISNTSPTRMQLGEWGLVPAWMRDEKSVKRLINARAETIGEKPTFKSAAEKRRCLIIADGFYEWGVDPKAKRKQPYRILLKDETPFAMAGIYNEVKNKKTGIAHLEFAIITTEANTLVAKIHNRMPAILKKKDEERWLDESIPLEDAIAVLKPHPANKMKAYPVSYAVNNPDNESPDVITPLDQLPTQKPLI